jgi:primase-polymerase (primpol)-like protein
VKSLFFGTLPARGRVAHPFEIYDSGRFFTLTGQRLPDTPPCIEPRQDQLLAIHRELFGDLAHVDGASDGTGLWEPSTAPYRRLLTRAVELGADAGLLELLDSEGGRTTTLSPSEFDYALGIGLLELGMSREEAAGLIVQSRRGKAAIERKGARRVPYWVHTIDRAAAELARQRSWQRVGGPAPCRNGS